MAKFRKKPVVIEAHQLPGIEAPGSTVELFLEWAHEVGFKHGLTGRDGSLIIDTLEGKMMASPGDWIIKGIHGEYYPCKFDIFEATYSRVG